MNTTEDKSKKKKKKCIHIQCSSYVYLIGEKKYQDYKKRIREIEEVFIHGNSLFVGNN